MEPESAAPLEATLASSRIPATVGAPTSVQVAVRNRASVAVEVIVRTVGADGAGEAGREAPLEPGATATVTATMVVPDRYPGQVLTAAIELVVQRAGTTEVLGRTILPVELVLDDGGQVAARLVRRDLRGRRTARIRLVLDNQTPHNVEVTLDGDSPTGELSVALPATPVTLAAGAGTVVEGRVRAPVRLWGGVSRYPFGVLVSTRRGTQRLPGNFSHRPIFARGLLGGLGLLVVVALWASALVVGLDRLADRGGGDGDDEVAQVIDDGPDGAGGAGGGGPGGGGAGGGAGADGGEDGGDEPAAPVIQVGGAVSGAAAAGVTVKLETVSLSDARQQGAVLTSTVRPISHHRGLTKVVGRTAERAGAVPMASLRTQVEPVAPRAGALFTTTNEDGLWGFADVRAPGYYLLTFAKAGYQTSKQVIETTEDSQGIDLEVALEAGKGSISGTVRGGGGPLGGAEVTVSDGIVSHTTTTASTGSVGSYVVEGLSTPGAYLVSVTRPGYGREARLVELSPSGTAAGIDLTLEPGVGALSGTISGPDGPQGGVTVRVEGNDLVREATTFTEGAAGRYILPQLPIPGSYTLHVEGEGWATETRTVDLRGDHQVDLALRRTTAQLSGTITDAQGRGLSSAGVVLEGDSGDAFRTVAANEGFFSMAGITPGSYVLRVERAGYAPAEHLVTLRAGDPVTVDVELVESELVDVPATATVTGTITNATPGPDRPGPDCTDDRVVGAAIEVVLGSPDPRVDPATLRTTADCQDGTFAVTGLPPGVHRVRATHPEFVAQELRVRVPAAGTAEASMAMTPLASIVVNVFSDATGERLAGSGVSGSIEPADDPELEARSDGALVRHRAFGAGGYQLTVRAPGHRQLTRSVTLVDGEELVVDVRLPRLGQLTVAVYDFLSGLDVTPAPDQPVELLAPDGSPARDATGALITPNPRATGPDGTVRFTGLAGVRPSAPDDGRYLVRVEGMGTDPVTVPVTVTENVVADDVGTVVLTASQEHFSGRILWKRDLVDAGVPGPRIQVRVVVGTQAGPDGTPAPVTRTYEVTGDANGQFAIDWETGLPPGSPVPISQLATLTISAPGFVTRTLADQQIDTDQFRAELTPRPGRLTGTVIRRETASTSAPGTASATVTSRNGATVKVDVDAQGRITSNPVEVPAGTYEITYSRPGYDPTTVVVAVPPGGDADASATIDKQGQVTVRARSLVSTGEVALAGASYEIQRQVEGAFVPHGSVSAAAGTEHTFANLTQGTYRVRATHPSHVRDGEPWQEVAVGIGGTSQFDFELRRLGSLEGGTSKRFENQPDDVLSGARIELYREGETDPRATTTSSESGKFSFPGLDDGSYRLEVTAPGHNARSLDVDLAVGEDRDVGVIELATQPVQFTGSVHASGPGGPPLSGVHVRLTAPDGTERTTSTGANGTYALADLAPQRWQVALSLNGYSPLQTSLDLTAWAGQDFSYTPKLVRIRNAIEGQVIGRFGPTQRAAVEGATVTVTEPDGSPVPDLSPSSYTTDANGGFKIEGLATGSYRLSITADGFVDPGARIVTVTETGPLKLQGPDAILLDVVPVDVTVEVISSVDHSGFERAVAARDVELVAEGGSTGTSQPPRTTGAGGKVSFDGVIPGDYAIVVAADPNGSRPGAEQDLEIALGAGSLTPTVEVTEGGIAGTVSIDEGEGGQAPVVGATVSLSDGNGVVMTSSTDDEGTYRFLVTPGVQWTVTPGPPADGYSSVPADIDVTVAGDAVEDGQDFLYRADPVSLTLSVTGPTSASFSVSGDGVTRSEKTGASVTFTDVLPNWLLTVEITASGYEPVERTITLDPGADRTEPAISMTPSTPDPP